MSQPAITLHVMPPSHPCMTARAALRRKGLEYELVEFVPGTQLEPMQEIYGEGNTRVPGMLVDDERVYGSTAILPRLEELSPEPSLYPEPDAAAIREAELWGDRELQDLGRRLPWGALHFRPEAAGSFAGGPQLEPAAVDYAIKFIRATWKYHHLTAEQLAADLDGLPDKLAEIERLIAAGVIGGDEPNAADLQIFATIRVLLPIRDLDPLLKATEIERITLGLFPEYPGEVRSGAYPAGWVPEP